MHFDLPKLNHEINILNIDKNRTDFWQQADAQLKMSRLSALQELIAQFSQIEQDIHSLEDIYSWISEEPQAEVQAELETSLAKTSAQFNALEMQILLNGEYDSNNAIIEIHPGAGGVDSQDWADILYHLYVRFAEQKRYKVDIIDIQMGEEAGIKSLSMLIKGKNAYGYLKGEAGVHRLVRISPFNADKKRHTSFASVDVVPEIENAVGIEILDKDLKIDTYRAGGAGGQHVNKTDSAIRITHIPTGIVVSSQQDRSQIRNRDIAMTLLKSRLMLRKVQEQMAEVDRIRGVQKSIEWGSQIRSYVFCPYVLVKDHRTGAQSSQLDDVLGGNIDEFIYAYLKWIKKEAAK